MASLSAPGEGGEQQVPEWQRPPRNAVLQRFMSWVKPMAMKSFQYRPLRSIVCWRVSPLRAGRKVALTLDDGPHPEFTPAALDVLADRGVRATFFVICEQVERYPEILQRLVDEGHEVGIHGYVHHNKEMPKQVLRSLEILSEFGIAPSLFRPPNGVIGLETQVWMAANGFTTALWSFDCRDSMRHEGKPGECDPLTSISPGEIILLHDDNPLCIEDLGRLLDHCEANELDPVTLSELFSR